MIKSLNKCISYSFFQEGFDDIPPGCHHRYCLLHQDFFINTNIHALKFGKMGFKYFDSERTFFLGLASWITLISVLFSIWGCLSLGTTPEIVQRSYWLGTSGIQHHHYSSTNSSLIIEAVSHSHFSIYVGLRSVVYINCDFVPGWDTYSTNCIQQSIHYSDKECQNGPFAKFCTACDENAKAVWYDAIFGLFGLILSWQGEYTYL